METTGSKLFKYRGQIPVIIFIAAIPILFVTPFNKLLCVNNYPNSPFCISAIIISAIITFLGLSLRAYTVCTTPKGTSGRNTSKQVADSLNTKGMYSVVRHPLYFANYLIWAGILVFTMNPFAFAIVSLVYWIYYERIMMTEEAFLRQKYGQEFEDWSQKVPAFFPKISIFQNGMLDFSLKTFIRREYATILSTLVSFLIVDYLNRYIFDIQNGISTFQFFTPMFWITVVYIAIALIIKYLKHRTDVLKADKNRD